MLELEVLISKLLTIDGFSTHTVSVGEVTSLDHKTRNDSMEFAPLVV